MARASMGRTLLSLAAALLVSGAAVGAAVGPAQTAPGLVAGGARA